LNFVNIENLNSKGDFIKARAESDSSALKKNSQMMKFIKEFTFKSHIVSLFYREKK